jgi:putative alpha-1,2-mannosidase
MKYLALLLVLFLFGCNNTTGPQQTESVKVQRRLTHFTVTLVLADQRTTVAKCVNMRTWGDTVPVGEGPYGCNSFNPATGEATIYATEPQNVDDAYTTLLGHELLHAYAGAYHSGTN